MNKTKSLIKQLNKASEKLNKENREIFTSISIYVRFSNIKVNDSEEFLQQILDSFLNAENRNVSIEEVLGTSSIKDYCREIVNTYKSSYNFISLLSQYVMFVGQFFIISSLITFVDDNIFSIIVDKFDFFTLSFNINEVILRTILMCLFVPIVIYFIKNSCIKKTTKSDFFKAILIILLLSMVLTFMLLLYGELFDNFPVLNMNIFIILIIGLTLYFTGKYFTEK